MEQQPSTGLGEWDVAQFVHDDAISIHQLFFKASSFFISLFFDEQVDQIDTIEEADFLSILDQVCPECCRDVCFSCSRSPDKDEVMPVLYELSCAELFDL